MSVIERSELKTFIPIWQRKPEEQRIEEMASYCQETKGIPDFYHYEIGLNGELFSPTAHCRIKDSVEEKAGHLGGLEYQAVVNLERWAGENSGGAAVWISPPYPGIYPDSKITIYEMEHRNGIKCLVNRTIIFEGMDSNWCLRLARGLASFSQGNPQILEVDSVRATPIFLKTHNTSWTYILEGLIEDPKLWESIRRGGDQVSKKEAIREATMVQKELFGDKNAYLPLEQGVLVMQRILGDKAVGCPSLVRSLKTAFQVFSENSLTYTSSISKDPDFCRNCPMCGKEINCVVRTGGSCPECGAVKRCG